MGCNGSAFRDCTGLTMGCLGKEPKVRKGGDLGYWGVGESWQTGAVCVSDSLHRQLEGGCTLGGSDIWVTATGETGVQAGQTKYLSPAGGIHVVHRCVYIFSLADLHRVQPEKAGWGSWFYLCWCVCFMHLSGLPVWLAVYICILVVGMCALRACT